MSALVPFNENRGMDTNGFPNMLDDFFNDIMPFRRSLSADTFKMDVKEEEKQYKIEAEMPGVDKKEVDLRLEDGRLTISVNHDESREEKGEGYVHRERSSRSMARSIYLADAADNGIDAALKDGVLSITVPKEAKKDKGRRIDIH